MTGTVVYGASRWDEPWLTEHHLAAALARRGPVLFVDPPQSLLTPWRERSDGRARQKVAGLLRSGARLDRGVPVTQPLMFPPVSNPLARSLSKPVIRRQVRTAARRLGLAPDLAVTARPLYELAPDPQRPFTVVLEKDWTRAGAHLTGTAETAVRAAQMQAWAAAGLICATSVRLRDRIASEGFPVALLRHGFDVSKAVLYEDPAPVPELDGLPRPLLGCVGRIDDRWSFPALRRLAEERPEATVLLVGPTNSRLAPERLAELLRLPNVVRFGAVPATDLPRWLLALDVCLIPYTNDEWQRYASPLKVWDYLYAARPIAATGSPAMGEFPEGFIEYADDPMRLPGLVSAALTRSSASLGAERRAYARANGWDERARQLLELVEERRAAAPPGP